MSKVILMDREFKECKETINTKPYFEEICKILDERSDALGLMNEFLRFTEKCVKEGLDKDELHIRTMSFLIMYFAHQLLLEKGLTGTLL